MDLEMINTILALAGCKLFFEWETHSAMVIYATGAAAVTIGAAAYSPAWLFQDRNGWWILYDTADYPDDKGFWVVDDIDGNRLNAADTENEALFMLDVERVLQIGN